MKSSSRWSIMKSLDKTDEEIIKSLAKKNKMKVFYLEGERDTIMTPLDSIRYYKHFTICDGHGATNRKQLG
jgi:penicillin-binding protein 1A